MQEDASRRHFLAAAVSVSVASQLPLIAQKRQGGRRKREVDSEKKALLVVEKRVEKVFMAPGEHPNALQAMDDGLWILDQTDPNKAHKVRYGDGSVLVEIQTESMHGSGITYGNDALWIASTSSLENCKSCLKTLKVDPKTGKTLAYFNTPGAVERRFARPGRRPGQAPRPGGAHGLEWVDGNYWIAVPPSIMIYQVQPETGEVVHFIPAPGSRRKASRTCLGERLSLVCRIERSSGLQDGSEDRRSAGENCPDGERSGTHGLTIRDGVLWYCDADSRWVCRLV